MSKKDNKRIYGYSDEFIREVVNNYLKGDSRMDIYHVYGVTGPTLNKWLVKMGHKIENNYIPPNKRDWSDIKTEVKK